MKYRKLFFLVLIIGIMGINSNLSAQTISKIKFMTENYPPFNFLENGKIQGFSVELIVATMKKIDPEFSLKRIKLLPWARGYRKTLKEENTCLFTTTRTKSREKLFKWVGPISQELTALTAKKDRNIKIKSIEDLKKYRIGAVIDDDGEQLLVERGIPLKNLDRVSGLSSIYSSIKKLESGRIDLFSYDPNVLKWEIRKIGLNYDNYEVVYILKKGKYYFAFNKNIPDTIIKKIQKSFDEVKKEGTYQKIWDKYFN